MAICDFLLSISDISQYLHFLYSPNTTETNKRNSRSWDRAFLVDLVKKSVSAHKICITLEGDS